MQKQPHQSDQNTAPVVVLAIGNVLRSDEGVGIHALRRLLGRYRLAQHAQALDGGVIGLDLLPHLVGCEALLVIDAMETGGPPGTVQRWEGNEIPVAWQQKLSMHQAGLFDLLAMLELQGHFPSRVVVWGIQPESLEWGLEPTPVVARSLDRLVDGVASDLRAWRALDESAGIVASEVSDVFGRTRAIA
jgi:hydrogenase maturation protease